MKPFQHGLAPSHKLATGVRDQRAHVRVALQLVVVNAVIALGVVVDRERHAHGQDGDHEQPRTHAGGDPRLPRQRHYRYIRELARDGDARTPPPWMECAPRRLRTYL